jgi:hypothetical protein
MNPPLRPPPISIEDEDRVGLAALAMSFSITLGVGLVTIALWIVTTMLRDAAPADTPVVEGAPFYVLVGGTMTGVFVAGLVTWTLLAPVRSTYRRGGLAFVSAFATTAAMLVAMPVNAVAGRTGLVALIAVCGGAAWLLGRRLARDGAGR